MLIEQRSAVLDAYLFEQCAEGVRVEARTPTAAVIAWGEPVNHVLHLLISVLLCGLWLPVWLLAATIGGERRRTITVDDDGHISEHRPGNMKAFLYTIGIAVLVVLVCALIFH